MIMRPGIRGVAPYTSNPRIDHVIYAVGDLEADAARFRDELGLESVVGGRHPGWGTANRIVPLGSSGGKRHPSFTPAPLWRSTP